jgi:hypothetical protein
MTNLHRLALLGLALAGANLALPAADPPALDDNLKNISKYLGQWAYKWKNETNGQFMKGEFLLEPGLGGKIILYRERMLDGDKTALSWIGFTYWHPRMKSLLFWNCASDGGYASGLQTKRGDDFTFYWRGFDAKGELAAGLGTDEWKEDDTFVTQGTHTVTNGIPKPDSQKTIMKRLQNKGISVSVPAPLQEHLKPMEKYLGKWNVEWAEKGNTGKAVYIAQAEAGGAAIYGALYSSLDAVNEPAWLASVTYWRPEIQSLASITFLGDGGGAEALVAKTGEEQLEQTVGYDPQGKLTTSVTRTQWSGKDTFTVQSLQLVVGGEVQPDGTKYTLTRIKE